MEMEVPRSVHVRMCVYSVSCSDNLLLKREIMREVKNRNLSCFASVQDI